MNSKLSALLDDELEQDEILSLCKALHRNKALTEEARLYSLIGASLRSEAPSGRDLTARVMAALENEPVALAPRRSRGLARWQRPALALAASVAGIAVVAAVAFAPQDGHVGQVIPALAMKSVPLAKPVTAHTLSATEMQEYLIAHQAHSMGATLGAGSQQVRTVSLALEGAAK